MDTKTGPIMQELYRPWEKSKLERQKELSEYDAVLTSVKDNKREGRLNSKRLSLLSSSKKIPPRPVDGKDKSSLQYLLHREGGLLVGCYAMRDFILFDQAFYKPPPCEAGWSWCGQKILTPKVYPYKDYLLTLPGWKKSTWNQMAAWSPQKIVPYQGLTVGHCCWQVGHPGVAAARLAWVNGSRCYWAHSVHLCHCGLSVHVLIVSVLGPIMKTG